jgi:hypothetical protein
MELKACSPGLIGLILLIALAVSLIIFMIWFLISCRIEEKKNESGEDTLENEATTR